MTEIRKQLLGKIDNPRYKHQIKHTPVMKKKNVIQKEPLQNGKEERKKKGKNVGQEKIFKKIPKIPQKNKKT